jgi:hypothetical protein
MTRPRTSIVRWSARAATIVIAASSLPVFIAGNVPAQAATATCTGNTIIFDTRSDQSLWLYQHTAPTSGDYTWITPKQPIGNGWAGRTIAGAGGNVYNITTSGDLHLLNYNVSTQTWANNGGYRDIGSDWQPYLSGALSGLITIDSQDIIYAVNAQGELRSFHYNTTTNSWDNAAGTVLDGGWTKYVRIFASGPGVIYAVDKQGDLFRYRYDAPSRRFTEYAQQVGQGWGNQLQTFSPGADIIYTIDASGTMFWYQYNDDTQTWSNKGVGRNIGNGWIGGTAVNVSPATDTCSVPQPGPVGTTSPLPPNATDPLGLGNAGSPGNPPYYVYLDAGQHADYVQDNGPTGLTAPTQIGTQTFASGLSTGSAAGNLSIAGIDSTGQVWLAQSNAIGAGFTSLAGSMRSVSVTHLADQRVLCAVDDAQQLWCAFDANPAGGDLTAWRDISGPANLSGPLRTASSGIGAYSVAAVADGTTEWFLSDLASTYIQGQVPGSANYDLPTPADGSDTPILFAREKTSSQPYVMVATKTTTGQLTGTWTPLPALTIGTEPMSAANITGTTITAVAAEDQNGHLYVASQTATDASTFSVWQQVGTEPAEVAPTLIANSQSGVDLVYRGQNGTLYHYTAPAPVNGSTLEFTGGPHS